LGALSASGLKSRKTVNEPMAPGFIHVFPPTCYRCPFGKTYPECGITCATIVEDVINMEDPSTVAAILVEPIGHTGGVIDPPEEYLPILREICDRHNILLIFDEIITGIGRTGRMFAAETFGVTPDVLLTAKGLSGGYAPLSAMICRRPIADAFWGPIASNPGFVEGHTFEGNPISCAAGLAVLREILERDLLANARKQGDRLRKGFEALATKYPIIGDIRGKGLFQAIEFVRDRATKARFPDATAFGVQVGRRALSHGLLCRFDPHWIAFGPPLVSSAHEIDEMVAILDRSLGEVWAQIDLAGSTSS
jgi:adenosylmethionine-8-amino-7-oxononanoate aminotransferase